MIKYRLHAVSLSLSLANIRSHRSEYNPFPVSCTALMPHTAAIFFSSASCGATSDGNEPNFPRGSTKSEKGGREGERGDGRREEGPSEGSSMCHRTAEITFKLSATLSRRKEEMGSSLNEPNYSASLQTRMRKFCGISRGLSCCQASWVTT